MANYSLKFPVFNVVLCRCKAWKNILEFTGTHKYANITLEQSHTRIRVCGLHFSEDSFANNTRNRLLKFAVPSLRLGSSSVLKGKFIH